MILLHQYDRNRLLAALPRAELENYLSDLESVCLSAGQLVCASEQQLQYVYFPTTCILSLQTITENGSTTEIAGIGNEGFLGISTCLGHNTATSKATVQIGGHAYRMRSATLHAAFNRGGPTMRILLNYTLALLARVSQNAVCNRHHTIEQQLARWMLDALDRLPSNQIFITQESIAIMLGVRREGVSESAHKLQKSGVIHYCRGRIEVVDRRNLESHACECYRAVQREYLRLFSDVSSRDDYADAAHLVAHASSFTNNDPVRTVQP